MAGVGDLDEGSTAGPPVIGDVREIAMVDVGERDHVRPTVEPEDVGFAVLPRLDQRLGRELLREQIMAPEHRFLAVPVERPAQGVGKVGTSLDDLRRAHFLEIEHPEQVARRFRILCRLGRIGAADEEILGPGEVVVIVGPVAHHGAVSGDPARRDFGGEERRLDPAHGMAEHEDPLGRDLAGADEVAIGGPEPFELGFEVDVLAFKRADAVALAQLLDPVISNATCDQLLAEPLIELPPTPSIEPQL